MKLYYIIKNYLHWCVWIASVFFSLAKFKISSEQHLSSLSYSDFEDGWSIINRRKDVSDFEWIVLTSTFKKIWPMLLFQIVFSALVCKRSTRVLPFFYSLCSVNCLTVILGPKATLCFMIYLFIMFVVHQMGRKSFCYIVTICALILKNSSYILDVKILVVPEENEGFLFDIALTWIMAKSLSFTCDRIDLRVHYRITVEDFAVIVSYCLYLPTVFTGPILSYELFVKQMNRRNCDSTLKIILKKIGQLCYIIFCFIVYEIMIHFLYSSSIQYYPDVAKKFDSWSLCGLGYALTVIFFFKYFIIYSLARSIASFENFEFPPPPKCISSIHLSSYLWRHFDRGLYLWILKYIYHPLMGRKYKKGVHCQKIFALAVSFLFVCLWHNIDKAVCMWTFLNFILVSSEMLMESILISKKLKKSLHTYVYYMWSTASFLVMCISSLFFLSNWEIGVIVFERVVLSGIVPLVPILKIMYCGVRVSMDVRKWEKQRSTRGH